MSALIDKLKNAARARGGAAAPDRLVEGGLLSQALLRAQAEREAARTPSASEQLEIDREIQVNLDAALSPTEAAAPASPRRIAAGLAAALLALVILGAAIALWHYAPGADTLKQPATLKLDHNLKSK
jgi:hypothetical protein